MLLVRIPAARPRHVLYREQAPVRVIQPRIFRMRNVGVKTPLCLTLTGESL